MWVWGGWLLTSTIVFVISALGNIFLRTVDPPCGAFWGEKWMRVWASVCTDVCISACACVHSQCLFSVCVFIFLCCNFAETDFRFSTPLLIVNFIHPQTYLSRKVWMNTHTVTHTLLSQFIKSRGFRSSLLPVFSELKSKGNFPFSFLLSQNFLFSFLPSSAVSFQRVCCSRPRFDPLSFPPSTPPTPPRAFSQLTGAVSWVYPD